MLKLNVTVVIMNIALTLFALLFCTFTVGEIFPLYGTFDWITTLPFIGTALGFITILFQVKHLRKLKGNQTEVMDDYLIPYSYSNKKSISLIVVGVVYTMAVYALALYAMYSYYEELSQPAVYDYELIDSIITALLILILFSISIVNTIFFVKVNN